MIVPLQNARRAIDLGENGYERQGIRMVDGAPQLVVVGLGFTVQGTDAEEVDFDGFKTRMSHFACTLRDQLGFEVTTITFNRRKGKRPWAEFELTTPEFFLPIPNRPAIMKSHSLTCDTDLNN